MLTLRSFWNCYNDFAPSNFQPAATVGMTNHVMNGSCGAVDCWVHDAWPQPRYHHRSPIGGDTVTAPVTLDDLFLVRLE